MSGRGRWLILAVALVFAALVFPLADVNLADAMQILMRGQKVQFSETTFDKSNFNQRTAVSARKYCEDSLNRRLERLEKATTLNDAQREKLLLAGQIDIHRYFAAYEATKRELKFGTIDRDTWQREFAEAQRKIMPLREQYEIGLHGKGSVFAKTIPTALGPQQQARVGELNQARNRERYFVYVTAAIALVDRKVPLTIKQRTRISEMLMETVPREFANRGNTPVFKVLANLGRFERELKQLLSEDEWEVLQKMILQSVRMVEADR